MKLKLNHVYLSQGGKLLLCTTRRIAYNKKPYYKLIDHKDDNWGWNYTANAFLCGVSKDHSLQLVEDLGKL